MAVNRVHAVFLEVLEWFDETGAERVHRIPTESSAEIMFVSPLVVRESQRAVASLECPSCNVRIPADYASVRPAAYPSRPPVVARNAMGRHRRALFSVLRPDSIWPVPENSRNAGRKNRPAPDPAARAALPWESYE